MKIFILFLMLTQADVSLDETLTWLMNFSKEHGYSREATSSKKLEIDTLRVVDGCSVVVEHEYFKPSNSEANRPYLLGRF